MPDYSRKGPSSGSSSDIPEAQSGGMDARLMAEMSRRKIQRKADDASSISMPAPAVALSPDHGGSDSSESGGFASESGGFASEGAEAMPEAAPPDAGAEAEATAV